MLTNELVALPSPINCQCRIDELLRLLRVKKNKLLIKFASGPLGYLGMYFAFHYVPPCLQMWHPLRRLYHLVFVRDFGMLRPYFGTAAASLTPSVGEGMHIYPQGRTGSSSSDVSLRTVHCSVMVLYEFQHITVFKDV